MQLSNSVFQRYIETMTSASTRARIAECTVESLLDEDHLITAKVRNSIGLVYEIEVDYTDRRIQQTLCTCDFRRGPVCEHVAAVLIAADSLSETSTDSQGKKPAFLISGKQFSDLSISDLFQHSTDFGFAKMNAGRRNIEVKHLAVDNGTFAFNVNFYTSFLVEVDQNDAGIEVMCSCDQPAKKLCDHQTVVLNEILESDTIRLFFDRDLREKTLLAKAKEYGLENEAYLDRFFDVQWKNGRTKIEPLLPLLPFNPQATERMKRQLLPKAFSPESLLKKEQASGWKPLLVIGSTNYTDALSLKVYTAQRSKEDKVKNPVRLVNAVDELLKTDKPEVLRFYAALTKYQSEYRNVTPVTEMEPEQFVEEMAGIKAVLANPENLPVYRHIGENAQNVTSASMEEVKLDSYGISLSLDVNQTGPFYEITGTVEAFNRQIPVDRLKVVYRYFALHGDQLTLIDHFDYLRTIDFLKLNNGKIVVHASKFDAFRQDFLAPLESKVSVRYSFIKPAPLKLVEQTGLNTIREKVVFLTDSENFVLITPALKYGDVEIPVLSNRQLYTLDQTGAAFSIERNEREEQDFLHEILRTHPDFPEQEGNEFFYLHKQEFLHEGWFLDAFEHWNSLGYSILGFSTLRNNNLNSNKMKVATRISSEIDWFDTKVKVSFGDQTVTLKQIQKSINNKTRYVKLGDGTMGILPQEWMERFAAYFRTGEIADDRIRIPKSLYAQVDELFDEEVLSEEVMRELQFYKEKVAQFEQIEQVDPPEDLQTELRDYQKQGLNWLNFLDEFGFGGCLADDMGLGKTVQVLAFILSQKEKRGHHTNLIVVPTSLIFNWIAEVEKFAPSLKVMTIHGANRVKNTDSFSQFDIILTTYGTLLSDITFMKKYRFQAIFLDESQAIKNPESKRYKAVRLLQAQNRIVLTGTPIENNTFDLYAQLSFAVPGLLGSPKLFNDHYAMPIDKFKDSARAKELQRKINPFLLRRTKKQVAHELPEKTEMVVYCEMGAEQRKVYDTYKAEFQRFLAGLDEADYANGNMHILAGLTKLRQICNSPALLSDQEYYGDESAKLTELMEQITSKSVNHKILVFSQFVGMLELIRAELDKLEIPFAYLTGKTKDRAAQVERFQSEEDVRVFLISLKAGGTGLNLTEADYVYIVDPWWNPAAENQAIDRSYRIGQKKNVMAIRLICPDTIEEKILRLQETKRELVNDLIHTDTTVLKSLSKQDLLGLV
ncbi:MAG TPA: SNF2-related protein [Fluviicola sp.]|nr:SNF2-related protein [Fluviicola sp.]